MQVTIPVLIPIERINAVARVSGSSPHGENGRELQRTVAPASEPRSASTRPSAKP
jgi:hypothetical protein